VCRDPLDRLGKSAFRPGMETQAVEWMQRNGVDCDTFDVIGERLAVSLVPLDRGWRVVTFRVGQELVQQDYRRGGEIDTIGPGHQLVVFREGG